MTNEKKHFEYRLKYGDLWKGHYLEQATSMQHLEELMEEINCEEWTWDCKFDEEIKLKDVK